MQKKTADYYKKLQFGRTEGSHTHPIINVKNHPNLK
jgi:hypothetical protein